MEKNHGQEILSVDNIQGCSICSNMMLHAESLVKKIKTLWTRCKNSEVNAYSLSVYTIV